MIEREQTDDFHIISKQIQSQFNLAQLDEFPFITRKKEYLCLHPQIMINQTRFYKASEHLKYSRPQSLGSYQPHLSTCQM
ncbi:CLUMA_CG017342, isoform A [Clunio marinus]|uniref:CLUMA_CG017342, isoform A n=1 Tax=Clunio marinus TaxID=568069 RepID=A0A1J1IVW0_9DIPT|nr:CLUMA_CG017342, isoform A [Clunio marinus]